MRALVMQPCQRFRVVPSRVTAQDNKTIGIRDSQSFSLMQCQLQQSIHIAAQVALYNRAEEGV
jgi:hypothetical protein